MKAVAVIAALCLVFVFVWERVDVVRLGYSIERLKTQKTLLERERDQLQVKVSALTAPERIAKVATDKLGLLPPQQGQLFIVHPQPDPPLVATTPAEQLRIARSMPIGGASK
jgi:cell division protein FtsL